MNKFIYLFIFLLFITSCKDESIQKDSGTLTLLFKLKYGEKDLVMFDSYYYPVTNQKLIFNKFSFYLSDLELKSSIGYTKYLDIDYLNLTNAFSTPATSAKGFAYKIEDIGVGAYSSIKFNLGVPKINNDKTPASYSSSNILSNQSEYWIDWKSYIFTRTEGQIDLDNDGSTETGLALHTGGNAALRTIEFPISKTLDKDGNITLEVVIDLKKQFGENKIYDIENDPQIHSATQVTQVKELIDNLSKSILIN
jgi:hypothetical protein